MRLYVVRHGIAIDRDDPDCPPDPDRFLTAQGVKRTQAAARGLHSLGVKPELIVTSPWLRAKETADIIYECLGGTPAVPSDTLLPHSGPGAFFELLHSHDVDVALCVGHSPHLDQLIAHSVSNPEADGRRLVTRLKKAGAACLEFTPWPHSGGLIRWVMEPSTLRILGRTLAVKSKYGA